jgi:hypothetical protein
VTGIAFLLAYFIYMLVVYVAVANVAKFQWSQRVWYTILFFSPLLLLSFLNARFVGGSIRFLFGVLLTVLALVYSYWQLQSVVDFKRIRSYVLKKIS